MRLILILLIVTGCSSCSGLFYYPDRNLYATPERYKIQFEDTSLTAKDGTKLHAQILKNKKGKTKGTILYFHGNAQNLSSHFVHLGWITNEGYDVLVFDYRGYGKSQGTPGQKGIQEDSRAALDWALNYHEKNNPNGKFVVYGQSLGGVVSMRALLDHPKKSDVDLVVMESTFSSYKDMAFDKMTSSWLLFLFSPLAYVVISDETAPQDDIKGLKRPLLVIHGNKDNVVPFEKGKEIYDLSADPRWFWEIENGRHTDIFFEHGLAYRKKFLNFLAELK